MDSTQQSRERSLSHKDYLETLHRPSLEQLRRISDIQRQKESEIDAKYHCSEAHEAATKIQKAYRGHRGRRQLDGLTLDPSSRWVEVIREWKYRGATVPLYRRTSSQNSNDGRPRTTSDIAKQHWRRAGYIAEHAVDTGVRSPRSEPDDYMTAKDRANSDDFEKSAGSMMMDMRYFLEMVDQKHRYGANLLVYHEEWQRSQTDQNFFHWLDYGEGRHVDLPACSRAKLDKERIRYLSRDERMSYLVVVDDEGKLRWHKNDELITTSVEHYKDSLAGIVPQDNNSMSFNDDEVRRELSSRRRFARRIARAHRSAASPSSDLSNSSDDSMSHYESPGSPDQCPLGRKKRAHKKFHVSPATILNRLLRASVKPGTWIYVCDTVSRLYVGIKSSGAFQHASFMAGARISSAGSIGIENGQLTYLSPLSGHYRPTTKSFKTFIHNLTDQGVNLSQVRVSHAYEVLLTMEYYGKSKKGAQKIVHHRKDHEHNKRPSTPDSGKHFIQVSSNVPAFRSMDNLSATSLVEQDWRKEHRKGLATLMDNLHIHRRSFDGSRKKTLTP